MENGHEGRQVFRIKEIRTVNKRSKIKKKRPIDEEIEKLLSETSKLNIKGHLPEKSDLFSEKEKDGTDARENENDIDLMMIFGMEDEAKKADIHRYNELRGSIEKQKIIKSKQEYISPTQDGEMTKRLRNAFGSSTLKLVAAIILLLTSAVFEYLLFIQKDFLSSFVIWYHPALIPLCAMQILLILIALGYKRFFRGFKLFSGRANIDSVYTTVSLILFAYYVFIALFGNSLDADGYFTRSLFLTPYALLAFFGFWYDLIKARREYLTFKVIRENGDERELTVLESFGRQDASEMFRSSKGKRALAVRSCSFVTGFVSKSAQSMQQKGIVGAMILLSLIVSLSLGVLGAFVGQGGVDGGISAFLLSLFLTMPFSLYVTYGIIPGSTVISEAKKNTAIIGDKTIEEYTKASALFFDDNAVFPSGKIKLKAFNIYEDNKMDDSFYILASVYTKIGSPAARLFRKSLVGEISRKVDIIEVSRNGLHASVDGRSTYIGSAEYISGCGYDVHGGEDEHSPYSILYMAVDHKTAIKVYIDYKLNKNAESLVLALKKQGKYLGIFTCDPCINEEMMSSKIPGVRGGAMIIRVNGEKTVPKLESGIVSREGVDGVLGGLFRAARVYSAIKIDVVIRFFIMAAGAFLALLFTYFSNPGASAFVYPLAVMLFGVLPTLLISAFTHTVK